uniref:Putative capsid protein n=1 Tax=Mika virus TaxID=2800928 RepID=A0A894KCP1_9VIRU|nr:MAG: putative capsid protein [Mika virus]
MTGREKTPSVSKSPMLTRLMSRVGTPLVAPALVKPTKVSSASQRRKPKPDKTAFLKAKQEEAAEEGRGESERDQTSLTVATSSQVVTVDGIAGAKPATTLDDEDIVMEEEQGEIVAGMVIAAESAAAKTAESGGDEELPDLPSDHGSLDGMDTSGEAAQEGDEDGFVLKEGMTLTSDVIQKLNELLAAKRSAARPRPRAIRKSVGPESASVSQRLFPEQILTQRERGRTDAGRVDRSVLGAVASQCVPHRQSNVQPVPVREAVVSTTSAVPGPAYTAALPPAVGEGGRIGRNSVVIRDYTATEVKACGETGQNFITQLVAMLAGNQDRWMLDDDQIFIYENLVLPVDQGAAPHTTVMSVWDKAYQAGQPFRHLDVVWDDPYVVAEVPHTALHDFAPTGNPESKVIVSQLRSKIDFSQPMVNRLCTRVFEGTRQYGLEGLFTVLYILSDYLWWAARDEVVLNLQGAEEGMITTINLAPTADQLGAAIQAAEEAITTSRICLNFDHLSAVHINVLRALTGGPAQFNADEDVQLIHSRIRTQCIRFAIYAGHAIEMPAVATPTANEIYATAVHLARLLHAQDDLVRGWTRAHTIVSGRTILLGRATVYFTSLLETEVTRCPKPVGRNFLWDFLCDRFTPLTLVPGLAEEYNTIMTLTLSQTIYPGAVMAAAISCCISTWFNSNNIGGWELNQWANRADVDVVRFLDAALVSGSQPLPGLIRCALTNLTACSGFMINWRSFRSIAWCGGFTHRALIPNQDLWQGQWNRYIPYLARVESLAWLWSAWHSVWGVSGPRPGLDVSSEIMDTLQDDVAVCAVWLGDDNYQRFAQSNRPFVFVPYGSHFINVARQHFRIDAPIRLEFQALARNRSGVLTYWRQAVDGNEWQPLFDGGTFCILPGTLRTYDWETHRVMGPIIPNPYLDVMNWVCLRTFGNQERTMAGYSIRRALPMIQIPRDTLDLEAALGAGVDDLACGQGARNLRQNEEN